MLNPGLVFLFPGQGSQSAGMLAGHLRESSVVVDTFTEASDCLGYDMQELVLEDAVQLVAFRGRAMGRAIAHGEGGMAAILGLTDEQVGEVCAHASEASLKVWPANYNCPGQVVIAGHAGAVEKAMLLAKETGAKRVMSLAVSVPSHTPLMRPAAEAMKARLREITLSEANRPVWSNASAKPVKTVREIRQALETQLVQPVLWTQTITNLYNEGVCQAVEMGPGKVLSGLVRRIARDLKVHTAETPEAMRKGLISLGQPE